MSIGEAGCPQIGQEMSQLLVLLGHLENEAVT